MTSKENYLYYNNFKVDVVGGYHEIDDLDFLKNYLESLNKKDIPYLAQVEKILYLFVKNIYLSKKLLYFLNIMNIMNIIYFEFLVIYYINNLCIF